MPAAKKKLAIPTFNERWLCFLEELFDAPIDQRIEALKTLDQELDNALDLLAEERRPKGHMMVDARGETVIAGALPVNYIRAQLDLKGQGNLERYIAALKG